MKLLIPEKHFRKSALSGRKSASGDFFSNPNQRVWEISLEAQSLCREKWPTSTKTASGLTYDGYQDFTWDAENRLTSIEVRDALVPAGAPKYRIEFEYDYSGRRISTKTFGGGTGNWTLANETKYIYDGWNVIAEFSGTGLISKSYLWGLDLSGSMQGAGGVGGLLSIEQHLGDGASRHYVAYDGNGNVIGLADADSGEMSALYEYDAFGQVLQMEGVYAVKNDYRFSTKPQEGMTGLIMYELRVYNPKIGRWLSRDPMGEVAGENLYAMVGNDTIGNLDILGEGPIKKFPGRGSFGAQSSQSGTDASNGLRSNPLLILRQIFGVLGTVSSGDVLSGGGVISFDSKGTSRCEFLITASGIFNNQALNRAFPSELVTQIPSVFGHIENTANVNNPTAYPLDFFQILITELKGINKPDRELARLVELAYKTALKNDCEVKCIVINVVGHSQGAAIVKSGLDLVPSHMKNRVRVVTIGAENFVPNTGLISAVNIVGEDFVPGLSLQNKIDQGNTTVISAPEIPGHARTGYLEWLSKNPKVIPLIK